MWIDEGKSRQNTWIKIPPRIFERGSKSILLEMKKYDVVSLRNQTFSHCSMYYCTVQDVVNCCRTLTLKPFLKLRYLGRWPHYRVKKGRDVIWIIWLSFSLTPKLCVPALMFYNFWWEVQAKNSCIELFQRLTCILVHIQYCPVLYTVCNSRDIYNSISVYIPGNSIYL